MRMRKKPNLLPRMERCADILIKEPSVMKGRWRELKTDASALWLEIGCGKGRFTAETAAANPDVLYIAIERVPDAMVIAMERCKELGLTNVHFLSFMKKVYMLSGSYTKRVFPEDVMKDLNEELNEEPTLAFIPSNFNDHENNLKRVNKIIQMF